MRIFQRKVSLLLFFLLLKFSLFSQDVPISLNLLQAPTSNRISENATRCMLKDSQGYLWIGTIEGLNRYDGYGYQIYYHDESDETSISGNYISDIFEDRYGNIWIATHSGLNKYKPECDCFQRYLRNPNDKNSLVGNIITDMAEDEDGKLWIASYGGLTTLEYQTNSFEHFGISLDDHPTRLAGPNVTSLIMAKDGGMWLGYDEHGISYWKNGRFTHFPASKMGNPERVNGLLEKSKYEIWIGTENGVFLLNTQTKAYHHFMQGERVWQFLQLKDGRVWAMVNFKGMWEWQSDQNIFLPVPTFYHHDKVGEDTGGDVRIYLEDKDGIIWGSVKGLAKQDPFEQRFRHLAPQPHNEIGFLGEVVLGITEDPKGRIYAASRLNGVQRYTPSTNKWEHHLNSPIFDNLLKDKLLSGPIVAYGNDLWVFAEDQWYLLDLISGQVSKKRKTGIAQSSVRKADIIVDKDNNLWVLDKTLSRYDTENNKQKDYNPYEDNNEKGQNLYVAEDGDIFLASDQYLYRYNQARDQFDVYEALNHSIPKGNSLICIHKASNGIIWLGRQNGLEMLNQAQGIRKRYTEEDGLSNHVINSILTDSVGNLWLMTNNGLSVFDPIIEKFRNYSKSDGLQDEIFLPRASIKSKTGLFYIGGVNGLNVFDPQKVLEINPHSPEVLITDFDILNTKDAQIKNEILQGSSINDADILNLSYKHTTLRFHFTALGYSQPIKNQYAYKIEGLHNDWNQLGNQRQIFISTLPRGKELTLKVKAANHDGIWSESPKELKLYVEPPFWEKMWFRGVILILVVLSVIMYNISRLKAIRKQNLMLQQKVDQATSELRARHQELADANQSLLAANEELETQAEVIKRQVEQLNHLYRSQKNFFTNLTHEFRVPLTLILGYLEELTQAKDSDRVELFNEIASNMQLNARQLQHLINQILDTVKLESGQYPLQIAAGDIVKHVDSIISVFQLSANRKQIMLEFIPDKNIPHLAYFDKQILNKLLYNLLSNAFKFTKQEGQIRVSLSMLDEKIASNYSYIHLTVSDTGSGISAEQLPHIFNRFYQANQPLSTSYKGSGIGLSLVKQLVETHKGNIEVKSQLEEGTTFFIKLPVNQTAFSEQEQLTLDDSEKIDPPLPLTEPAILANSYNSNAKSLSTPKEENREKLLVIDDNPQILQFIIRQLHTSYHIISAENADIGWELAYKQQPDLIISDVMMPGTNGIDLCDKLKNDIRTCHIPIILLTALSADNYKISGLESGADAYLTKPFSKKELHTRVKQLTHNRKILWEQFLRQSNAKVLPNSISDQDQTFLTKLNEFIEANLTSNQLSLEKVIETMNMSKTPLFKKVKSITGLSVMQYIRDYRLRRAYELLQENKYSISEIIDLTGFNSPTYFYRSFKQKFGYTPKGLINV